MTSLLMRSLQSLRMPQQLDEIEMRKLFSLFRKFGKVVIAILLGLGLSIFILANLSIESSFGGQVTIHLTAIDNLSGTPLSSSRRSN